MKKKDIARVWLRLLFKSIWLCIKAPFCNIEKELAEVEVEADIFFGK